MLKDCVVPSVKHDGESVMGLFWWLQSWRFDLNQRDHEKKITTQFYQGMQFHLAHKLLGKIYLQPDNEPKHASKLCKNYLANKEQAKFLLIMTWPPQSCELSPIELVWD